jgi:phage gp45-like
MENNFLDNGAVLPAGLLNENDSAMMAGFNKTYKNYPLRVGIVIASYPVSDSNNISKLTTEYDILVIEQNEDKGAVPIRYLNCMSSEGMGSIADYFEKTLRPQTNKTNKGAITLNNQDGAIVLLLCLDAMSDKGVIISALTHPDRTTNLTTSDPYLEGEYNGVNIVVNTDGSAVLTLKGATDNYGVPINPPPSPTTVTISSAGEVTISAPQQSINVNCMNANVIATDTATVDGKTVKLGANATEAVILGDTFQALYNAHTHPTILGPTLEPIIPMPSSALSTKVETE